MLSEIPLLSFYPENTINTGAQTYREEEIEVAWFMITGIENVYLWSLVPPMAVLPLSGTACSPFKYGMVEKDVLHTLC